MTVLPGMTYLGNHAGQMLIALAAGFIGGFIRGYSGFGFALASVPVLTLAFTPAQAVPVVLPIEVLLCVTTIPQQRTHIDWNVVRWLVLGTMIGTPIGLAVLASLPANVMRLFVGAAVLLAVVVIWRRPALPNMLRPASLWGAGFTSGLLNGGTAMSGPPVILALLSSGLPPLVTRACLMMFIAIGATWAASVAAVSGLYGANTLAVTLVTVPSATAGGWAGTVVFDRFAHAQYRKASFGILIAITAIAVGTTGWTITVGALP
jgi:uncharacterized membrane protein YfcA